MTDRSFCDPPDGVGQYDRDFLDQCLQEIARHADDQTWISANLACIHKVLRGSIQTESLVETTIDLIVKLVRFFILGGDYAQPLSHSAYALLHAMTLKDANLVAKVAGAQAFLTPVNGDLIRTRTVAQIALDRLGEVTDRESKLHAMLRVIQALSYYHFDGMPRTLFDEALELASMTEDRRLVNEVFLALSHAYCQLEDGQQAEKFGCLALTLAGERGDLTFKRRALFIIGVSLRVQEKLREAEKFVRASRQIDDGFASPRRDAYTLGELAAIYCAQEKYVKSEFYYAQALELYTTHKMPYEAMQMREGLGLVWSRQGRYAEARVIFHQVLDEYRWIKNLHAVANITWALGRIEARSGNPRGALTYLREANGLLRQLAESPARDTMLYWVEQWIADVLGGLYGALPGEIA